MDDRCLRYFIMICEKGSLSAASESLFVSQQALSTAMQRLEKELKTSLFTRTPKGMTLTRAGAALLPQAKKILDLEREVIQTLNDMDGISTNLTIGCAFGIVSEFPNQLLNTYELTKLGINLKVIEYTDIDCETAVEQGKVEIGLAIGPLDKEKFFTYHLASRRYCFLIHNTHPLAKYEKISLKQLEGERLVCLNKKFKISSILESLCKKKDVSLNIIYESGEIAPMHELVRNRYGIGESIDYVAKRYAEPDIHIAYLKEEAWQWDLYAITKKNTQLSKEGEIFLQYLVNCFL